MSLGLVIRKYINRQYAVKIFGHSGVTFKLLSYSELPRMFTELPELSN